MWSFLYLDNVFWTFSDLCWPILYWPDPLVTYSVQVGRLGDLFCTINLYWAHILYKYLPLVIYSVNGCLSLDFFLYWHHVFLMYEIWWSVLYTCFHLVSYSLNQRPFPDPFCGVGMTFSRRFMNFCDPFCTRGTLWWYILFTQEILITYFGMTSFGSFLYSDDIFLTLFELGWNIL